MLLVDRLLSFSDDTAECGFRISAENAFLISGFGVPAYISIEYMAQCIAVHAGVRAYLSGRPLPIGFLLGSRQLELHDDYLEEGRDYLTTCRKLLQGADGMGSFECNITSDGRLISKGRLAVLERHDDEKFGLRVS
jgi:predicted hotdog family 3-hydroxylacyl-ACP dehydratase